MRGERIEEVGFTASAHSTGWPARGRQNAAGMIDRNVWALIAHPLRRSFPRLIIRPAAKAGADLEL